MLNELKDKYFNHFFKMNQDLFTEKLKKFNKKECIKFILFCIKKRILANNNCLNNGEKYINLVEEWLKCENNISQEQLKSAYLEITKENSHFLDISLLLCGIIHPCDYVTLAVNIAAFYINDIFDQRSYDEKQIELLNNIEEIKLQSKVDLISINHSKFKDLMKDDTKNICIEMALFCIKNIFNANYKNINIEIKDSIDLAERYISSKEVISKQYLRSCEIHLRKIADQFYDTAIMNAIASCADLFDILINDSIDNIIAITIEIIIFYIAEDFNLQSHKEKTEEIMNKLKEIQFGSKKMSKEKIHNFFMEKLSNANKNICVRFALFCAKGVMRYNNHNTNKVANECIKLVEKYLLDKNSVSRNELLFISDNAADIEQKETNSNAKIAILAAYYAASSALYNILNFSMEDAAEAATNVVGLSYRLSFHEEKIKELLIKLEEIKLEEINLKLNFIDKIIKKYLGIVGIKKEASFLTNGFVKINDHYLINENLQILNCNNDLIFVNGKKSLKSLLFMVLSLYYKSCPNIFGEEFTQSKLYQKINDFKYLIENEFEQDFRKDLNLFN